MSSSGLAGRWIGVLGVVAVVLAAIAVERPRDEYAVASPALAVAESSGPSEPAVPGTTVNAGVGADCGQGWTGGQAGRQTFALTNDYMSGMEVYLEDADTRKVYLDVEGLGTGATRSVSVVLGPGRYRFYCIPDDTSPGEGAVQTVTGSTSLALTPGLVPVTSNDLRPLMQRYEAWVSGRLPLLARQVRTLRAALGAGDLAAAKRDWLAAHMTYETLGGAYGAFGDYGTAINGDSSPASALEDTRLRGFHKIEAELWSGAPASRIVPYAVKLVSAVGALRTFFDSAVPHMNPIDVGLRAHEILEDADLVTLDGQDDYGSHTSLATLAANITGTYHALDVLKPVLASTDPALTQTYDELARTRRLVESYDRRGAWTPLQRLSRSQREMLNATVGEDVELLSRVAVITDPRPEPLS